MPAVHELRPITVADMQAQASALLHAHWEEVAKRRDLMVLAPDWPRYEQLEAKGALMSVGAFVDGVLVGYSLTLVGPHLHYVGLTVAQNDVLFVAREHRHGRIGLDLIRKTEEMAKERGARLVTWHAKEATALAGLLPRLGYDVHEVIFSKGVG